jgi:hypothetical protein
MKLSGRDRILLLVTILLAAYQVAVGIDGLSTLPIITYTIAFGVLLVAGLLLFILGLDVLDSPIVIIVSTVIPVSLSLGLAWEYLAPYRIPYLLFAIIGLAAVIVTRSFPMPEKLPVLVLAIVHGIAGMTIFLLPIIFGLTGIAKPGFALVGFGGALIGIGGLLLSFLKTGMPILSRETILKIFPGLLLVMTAAYVVGFALR